jgi:hypothetical protein
MCIGKNFGLRETVYIVAKLTRLFRFTIPQDYKMELTSMIAVKPKCDLRLIIESTSGDVSNGQPVIHS